MTVVLGYYLVSILVYYLFNGFSNLMVVLVNLIMLLFYLFNWFGTDYFCSLMGGFGLDLFSYYMILMTMWLYMILFYSSSSWDSFQFYMINFMIIFMLISFMQVDLISFYFFFECSMVPILILLWGWGSYKGRYMAGMYMFLYTMITSLPMLCMMIYLSDMYMGLMFNSFHLVDISGLMFLFMVLMFMVKVPIFGFHLWLPKAHVEAPIYGSMVLASIMLKLGGYGVIRFLSLCDCMYYLDFLMVLSLMGSLFMSIMCLYYLDLKVIVAYSSVVHMCMMFCGLISGSFVGLIGAYFMMLSHSFSSSGLFYSVNVLYVRSGSRLMLLNKGVIMILPMFVFMMFLLIVGSMGVPPSFTLLSELLILMGVLMYMDYIYFILFICMFFSSFYMIKLIMFMYNKHMMLFKFIPEISVSEYMVILFHLLPMNFMILFINSLG